MTKALLLAALFCTFCLGCKKDKNNPANELVGEWVRYDAAAFTDRRTTEYRFNNDGTLLTYIYYLDPNKHITGYEGKGTFKYRITPGNHVEVYDGVIYVQDPAIGYNSTESQLVRQTATTPVQTQRYFYSFKNDKNELSLVTDCGPAANCTSMPPLTRK